MVEIAFTEPVGRTRMRTESITFAFVLTVALFSTGCGVDPKTLQSLRDAVNTVSTTSAVASHDLAEPMPVDSQFIPPHPERMDPFSFSASGPVSVQERPTIPVVAQVQVLGFAQVDEPRVLLRTKGTTMSLKVGDRIDGIQVMAIDAPTVELQMGSLLWTASMFEG